MSTQKFFSIKKAVSLAGVAGVSSLLALPAMAQMQPSPANSNSPAQCLPSTGQVTPTDSPTGGATMEQMQATDTQSMNQSNLNMNSPYSGSAYGTSSQANAGYMRSQNLQANQSNMSAGQSANRMSYQSAQVTPTYGPAGGYTMERFRLMDGESVASADMMGTRQSYNSSGQSSYQANSFTRNSGPMAGPAGGYTANSLNSSNNMGDMGMNQSSTGMMRNNMGDMGMNQSSIDTQYGAGGTTRPLPGSMASDRNRPASEMTPEMSQRLDNQTNSSIYRVGPSSSNQSNTGSAIGGC